MKKGIVNKKGKNGVVLPKKGRPSNEDKAASGRADSYDFKFEDSSTSPLSMFRPMDVENFLLLKGFKRVYTNIDPEDEDLPIMVGNDNMKRVGIAWLRYSHPSIPPILGSDWNIGIIVNTSLVDNPSLTLSFALYHKNLEYHFDFGEGYSVSIKACDRNKIGLESGLTSLFFKYSALQRKMIVFNKSFLLTNKNKGKIRTLLTKARLSIPFVVSDDYIEESVDTSELDRIIDKEVGITRALDYIAFYNNLILSGEKRISYKLAKRGLDSAPETAGIISNVRRKLELQKKLAIPFIAMLETGGK
jgi:hypothetical protein